MKIPSKAKKFLFAIFILACPVLELSCINQLGIQGPALNRKKQIRKIAPPFTFSAALFSYREKYGFWPKSEYDFSSYASSEVKQLYELDFESWFFGNFSDDAIDVHFIHRPIEDGAHVGIIPIPYGKIRIKTSYTFSSRHVTTRRVKK